MNDLPPLQTPQQASQRKQPQYQYHPQHQQHLHHQQQPQQPPQPSQQLHQQHLQQQYQPKVYYQPPPPQQQQQIPQYQYQYQSPPPTQQFVDQYKEQQYKEPYNKEQYKKEQYKEQYREPYIKEQYKEPYVKEQYKEPYVKEQYKEPYNKEQYKEPLNNKTSKLSSKQKLEVELRNVFDKVDVNRTGRISGKELSFALLNFDHTRFQDSTIKLMINLFSTDSKLNFEQFISLWKYLSAYKKLFIQADSNKSGDISFGEFQKILEQIGYKLDIDLVLHLFQKYSTEGAARLKFDSFIELLVYLRKLTDIFKKYDKDLSGTATIGFSDFLFEISQIK